MRRARDSEWLVEDTNFMGINFGADFCAEHEWGVAELCSQLGVSNDLKVLGIDRRLINQPKEGFLHFLEEEDSVALIGKELYNKEDYKKIDDFSRELAIHDKMVCAWSDKDFGIRVSTKDKQDVKRLNRLYKAINEKDAAIWLGGGHAFCNAGLVIGIVSHISAYHKEEMYNTDLDYQKLQKASKEIGIKQKIDELNEAWMEENKSSYFAPCSYYALRAAWASSGFKTKYPVMYWLNPRNQDVNNTNWVTVEQLEQWMEGRGSIIKEGKERTEAEIEKLKVLAVVSKAVLKNR